ncbi:putative serine/threonine protein kinase [Streptomyces scabiei 87.22]|uniref:non-specific serine/threonine protein kinase n=1 Tax=Streptomyces scabiei (strain 87.22) TaxID=680198 RepID=C9ZCU0_STRSW|nr:MULTISPECIES: protein kinase [Streptomyces]MBP5911748.1 protein kinase [Streptomyces sp. LBUM 1486]MDX2540010.1 protein kinase [Streptomyces scabiei]MDX2581670.1 protein kinase [Streptomyces scabiei]MDX2659059.1 protein kinase [Streptomyces scabiei]MDX2726944.1 protein kinase [Streptomyces scabiei]
MIQRQTLAGRYRVGSRLGSGGMAEVYLAQDLRLGRTVAVKTLRADMAFDPYFRERFRREARSAASLNHPSVVAVYDSGEEQLTGGGVLPYIVMEYVPGTTLAERLRSEIPPTLQQALELTDGVLRALEHAHGAGIVHRDVKPANVMLTADGAVKVMDFGIARAMSGQETAITQASIVIGTAEYLSPEQAIGQPADARSDLYAVGCLFHELLTGRPPFHGGSPLSVAHRQVRETLRAPSEIVPGIPPEVDALVLKALAKDPAQRHQDAPAMRAAVAAVRTSLTAEAPTTATLHIDSGRTEFDLERSEPPSAATRKARNPRRRTRPRRVLHAVAVSLVIALGGAGTSVWLTLHSPAESRQHQVPAPDLLGRTLPDARAQARTTGFRLVRSSSGLCSDLRQTGGRVCGQSPSAGSLLDQGSVITVFVAPRDRRTDTASASTTHNEILVTTQWAPSAALFALGSTPRSFALGSTPRSSTAPASERSMQSGLSGRDGAAKP